MTGENRGYEVYLTVMMIEGKARSHREAYVTIDEEKESVG